MLNKSLSNYLAKQNLVSKFSTALNEKGGYITLANTSNPPKEFDLGLIAFVETLQDIKRNSSAFNANRDYEEKAWRSLAIQHFTNAAACTLTTTQTKPFFASLSKLIKWANSPSLDSQNQDEYIELTDEAINNTIEKLTALIQEYSPKSASGSFVNTGTDNILLYGPPGTGKTREIQQLYLAGKNDDEKEFITFHQSYSYEEFIEGIKPSIGSSEKVLYTFKNLRDLAHNAFRHLLDVYGFDKIFDDATTKESTIGAIKYIGHRFPKFFGSNNVVAQFEESQTKETLSSADTLRYYDEDLGIDKLPHSYFTTQWGDIEDGRLSFKSLRRFIDEKSEGTLQAVKEEDGYLLVQKISQGSGLIYEYSDGIFYRACKKAAILAGYASLDDCTSDTEANRASIFEKAIKEGKIFTFCIDEINRANVASVFGELITLIETDKRLGCGNELIVRLPYSKRQFGVPANLQLVGSMNTADRSITLLDSALRRRFTFKEVAPKPETLKEIGPEGIDLEKLLITINKRIKYFLSKDLCIGHAYFLSALGDKDRLSKSDVLKIFINKIIPLLDEYFYNNFSKLSLVLADAAKQPADIPFFIRDKESEAYALFKGFYDDLDEKESYILNPLLADIASLSEEDIPDRCFIAIYE